MLARNSSSSEHCISISTTAWATFYAREEEKVPGRRTRDVLQHRQSVQGRARGTAQERAVEGPEQVSQTQWSRGGSAKEYTKRRPKTQGGALANKPPYYNKCTFAEGGVKCPERSIPCSKFCRRHIMQDRIGSRCSSGHVGSRRADSSVERNQCP